MRMWSSLRQNPSTVLINLTLVGRVGTQDSMAKKQWEDEDEGMGS